MAQYQTFPDAAGDSRTLEKLKALKLPDLAGRSFLDVGCNEGFFCGFAKFIGAAPVVGVDRSALFIERARQRFPECVFLQQGWDDLPEGPFDVILLASALHYADDQAALLHRLVERLAPDGVLVLELGIVSSPDNAWVKVTRGIDEREFPTMEKLREVLGGYAWKWMGRSVTQDGDPVARHVVHISRRRPFAFLMMQPPAYGKSSIAERLFAAAGVPVVSGDQQVALIAQGKVAASDRLRAAAARDYSPFRIDETIDRIFEADLGAELAQVWAAQAQRQDFVLDMYVPQAYQPLVEQALADLGYLPVQLQWQRPGPPLLSAAAFDERADSFYSAMGHGAPVPVRKDEDAGVLGFVDEVAVDGSRVMLRGWAVDKGGVLPGQLQVLARGRLTVLQDLEVQARPDVQKHLNLPHAQVGFRAVVELPGVTGIGDLGRGFSVSGLGGGTLRLAQRVVKLLAANG